MFARMPGEMMSIGLGNAHGTDATLARTALWPSLTATRRGGCGGRHAERIAAAEAEQVPSFQESPVRAARQVCEKLQSRAARKRRVTRRRR